MGYNAELVRCSLAIKGELSSSRRMSRGELPPGGPVQDVQGFLPHDPSSAVTSLALPWHPVPRQSRRALLQDARMRRAETAARRLHRGLPSSSRGERGGPTLPHEPGHAAEEGFLRFLPQVICGQERQSNSPPLAPTELCPERTQSLLQPSQPLRSPEASS